MKYSTGITSWKNTSIIKRLEYDYVHFYGSRSEFPSVFIRNFMKMDCDWHGEAPKPEQETKLSLNLVFF